MHRHVWSVQIPCLAPGDPNFCMHLEFFSVTHFQLTHYPKLYMEIFLNETKLWHITKLSMWWIISDFCELLILKSALVVYNQRENQVETLISETLLYGKIYSWGKDYWFLIIDTTNSFWSMKNKGNMKFDGLFRFFRTKFAFTHCLS